MKMRKSGSCLGSINNVGKVGNLLFIPQKPQGVYGCASPLSKRIGLALMLLVKKYVDDIFILFMGGIFYTK